MVNPWLVLAGAGMIIVGVGSIVIWNRYRVVKPLFYGIGFLAWFLSIAIKVLMDLTITTSLILSVPERYRLLTACLYYGLRTGFLESGFLYLVILKIKPKKLNYNEAVSIGIAYGAIEAILTGFSYMVNVIVFYFQPELLEKIPEAQKTLIEASLNLDTIVIFAPIIERIVVLVIHIMAAVLVVMAFKKYVKYLFISIAYKSLVDGIIPLLKPLLVHPEVINYYLIEIPFITIALFSLPVLKRLAEKFKEFNKFPIIGFQLDLKA